MFKFFEASVIVVLSIVFTALILAFVIPVHALGGAPLAAGNQDVRPAVHVDAVGRCPVDAGTAQKCPALARQPSDLACPYLSAMAAAARCPALDVADTAARCPGLAGGEFPKPRGKVL